MFQAQYYFFALKVLVTIIHVQRGHTGRKWAYEIRLSFFREPNDIFIQLDETEALSNSFYKSP